MAKRPTPKKRRAKSKGRHQYAVYVKHEIQRLEDRQNSPYARLAPPKRGGEKAIEKITRIKA
jgi:hypothetical protein